MLLTRSPVFTSIQQAFWHLFCANAIWLKPNVSASAQVQIAARMTRRNMSWGMAAAIANRRARTNRNPLMASPRPPKIRRWPAAGDKRRQAPPIDFYRLWRREHSAPNLPGQVAVPKGILESVHQ